MNPLDLSGKRVLVTGASSGIGRATAVYLSRLGANLILSGRNQARLDETLAALSAGAHRCYPVDLDDLEAIPAWMKQIAGDVGPLTGLVHSAGRGLTRPLKVLTYSDYASILRINLDAAVMLSKAFRQKGVRDESASSIVYVSSVVALRPKPALAAYAASKGALISLARTLARELAPEKIRVNCVCPGIVQTSLLAESREAMTSEQFDALLREYPLGAGAPEDVAYAIAFLLASSARWITGAALVIDGGYSA